MTDDWVSFDEAVSLLRSRDQMTYEDGHHLLLANLDEVQVELLARMLREPEPRLRASFVELLGYADDPALVPVLERELGHEAEAVQGWALSALDNMGQRGVAGAQQIADAFRASHAAHR